MGFPSRSNVFRALRDQKQSGHDERLLIWKNPLCVEPRTTDGIETKAKQEKVHPWNTFGINRHKFQRAA